MYQSFVEFKLLEEGWPLLDYWKGEFKVPPIGIERKLTTKGKKKKKKELGFPPAVWISKIGKAQGNPSSEKDKCIILN